MYINVYDDFLSIGILVFNTLDNLPRACVNCLMFTNEFRSNVVYFVVALVYITSKSRV